MSNTPEDAARDHNAILNLLEMYDAGVISRSEYVGKTLALILATKIVAAVVPWREASAALSRRTWWQASKR